MHQNDTTQENELLNLFFNLDTIKINQQFVTHYNAFKQISSFMINQYENLQQDSISQPYIYNLNLKKCYKIRKK